MGDWYSFEGADGEPVLVNMACGLVVRSNQRKPGRCYVTPPSGAAYEVKADLQGLALTLGACVVPPDGL